MGRWKPSKGAWHGAYKEVRSRTAMLTGAGDRQWSRESEQAALERLYRECPTTTSTPV